MKTIWPAEWEKHKAAWMIWPMRKSIWPDIEKAYAVYAKIANLISEYEPLKLIISNEMHVLAKRYLSSAIECIDYGCDDSWARDTMPVFIFQDQKLQALNFQFNAWGEKFHPFDADQRLKPFITTKENIPAQTINFVLEGGAIHSNGNGVLLTTKECLLNPNRNPLKSQKDIENQLMASLNVNRQLWLPFGIDGDDDTDGHVDNVACFANQKTILIQSCYTRHDPNFIRHQANMEYLATYANDMDIIEIDQPQKRLFNGSSLALSYLNFYLCNEAVIMPSFNDKRLDLNAKAILQEQFPHRHIHQINALDLIVGGGGIHCITMQQPDPAAFYTNNPGVLQ
ncbi:agmatine deiminase family protein [Facilibium subflavum]|uniref:agmatine deiminase family protein n=1 Tax=Facilibium subflavum TaxID=2219058 RepID=UPI000E653FF5|nr:agmatine deiminase family protein [Facilibium subflavum]